MSIKIEDVQRLLTRAPSKDTAEALKEWRAQMAYSQPEAAIRLGVPLERSKVGNSGGLCRTRPCCSEQYRRSHAR